MNENIQTLVEGRDGSLWIGHARQSACVRFRDGRFETLTRRRDGLPDGFVSAMLEDPGRHALGGQQRRALIACAAGGSRR